MKEIKLSVKSDAYNSIKVIPTFGSKFLSVAYILESLAHFCFLLTMCRLCGQISQCSSFVSDTFHRFGGVLPSCWSQSKRSLPFCSWVLTALLPSYGLFQQPVLSPFLVHTLLPLILLSSCPFLLPTKMLPKCLFFHYRWVCSQHQPPSVPCRILYHVKLQKLTQIGSLCHGNY